MPGRPGHYLCPCCSAVLGDHQKRLRFHLSFFWDMSQAKQSNLSFGPFVPPGRPGIPKDKTCPNPVLDHQKRTRFEFPSCPMGQDMKWDKSCPCPGLSHQTLDQVGQDLSHGPGAVPWSNDAWDRLAFQIRVLSHGRLGQGHGPSGRTGPGWLDPKFSEPTLGKFGPRSWLSHGTGHNSVPIGRILSQVVGQDSDFKIESWSTTWDRILGTGTEIMACPCPVPLLSQPKTRKMGQDPVLSLSHFACFWLGQGQDRT